jgi:hypothetical protein
MHNVITRSSNEGKVILIKVETYMTKLKCACLAITGVVAGSATCISALTLDPCQKSNS